MDSRNTRIGMVLFFLYLVFYSAFVVINAYVPEIMERTVGGLNLAILYGFSLITVALLMALLYGWLNRGGEA